MTDEQFEVLQEMLSAMYIQITRMYDMMAIIGDKLGADVIRLTQQHEAGILLAPDPWISGDENDSSQVDPVRHGDADNVEP